MWAVISFCGVSEQIFVILVKQICLFMWTCFGIPTSLSGNWVFVKKYRFFFLINIFFSDNK